MRTIVDLPDEQIAALKRVARAKKVSRAEVIREAVAQYLVEQTPDRVDAFGLWGGARPREDGVAYQRRLRREWRG